MKNKMIKLFKWQVSLIEKQNFISKKIYFDKIGFKDERKCLNVKAIQRQSVIVKGYIH